jgi:hypothetical protein
MNDMSNTDNTDTVAVIISDLCDRAATELRQLNTKKAEVIQTLAKEIEQRGIPKNKVARIVVRELINREVASPDYVYECLGIDLKEQKKSHVRRKVIEDSAKTAEQSVSEQSPGKEILISAGGSQIHDQSFESEPDEMVKWINPDEIDRLEEESKELRECQGEEPRQEKINRYKEIIQNFIKSNFVYGFESRNLPTYQGESILLYHREKNEYIPISVILNSRNKIINIRLNEGEIEKI